MLAPFFMKMHDYSIAVAGIPLVANGIGRVASDLLSGIMATYFSAGRLLIAATVIALATSAVGYLFLDTMSVFVGAWIIFGLTEAMFALALRKIGFDQSAPERQGRVQGQMASALGFGFGRRLHSRTAFRRLRRQVARAGWTFFSLFRASIIRFAFYLYRRRPTIPKNCPSKFSAPMARRGSAFTPSALSRLLPRYLPVISVSGRSDADRVSFFSHESRWVESGSSRDHGCRFTFDRYPWTLQRRLAL